MTTVVRWLTAVVRALGPRRDPLPAGVVLLWVATFVLPVATALVVASAPCYQDTAWLCRWPSTQVTLPAGVGSGLLATAVLATRSAFREQRGEAERTDWTALGWVVPVVVLLGLVVLVRSYG